MLHSALGTLVILSYLGPVIYIGSAVSDEENDKYICLSLISYYSVCTRELLPTLFAHVGLLFVVSQHRVNITVY